MKLAAGDIVRVEENTEFPADLILLQSSNPKGICNIETANLDGETNLKIKKAIAATYDVECEDPNGRDYPLRYQGLIVSWMMF